jgi:cytochrome c oxidase subunit 3
MNAITSNQLADRSSAGRIGLLITLATESVLFITILVAYAALRDQVNWYVPHTLSRLSIPVTNTAILFSSSLVAWWSQNAIRQGKKSALTFGLLITVILGLIFVTGQIYEFRHAGLSIDDQSFGGVFFTLLGFHAVHVLAGVFFLVLNLVRSNLGDFSAEKHEAVTLGTWFWYFVTAVWAVLFVALYLV